MRDKKDECRLLEFRRYLNSIGLRDSTVAAYCDYIENIEHVVGMDADVLVSSDHMMEKIRPLLIASGMNCKTAANLFSGLKNYYRFVNRYDYRRCGNAGVSANENESELPDVPFELKAQLNDLQLRMLESRDSIWRSLLEIGVAVLTIIPAIVVDHNDRMCIKTVVVISLVMGFIGVVATVFVLKRTARVLKTLSLHAEMIRKGEETELEFNPCENTMVERFLQWIAAVGLSISVMAIIALVVVKTLFLK